MIPVALPDAHVFVDWLLRTSLQVSLLVAAVLLVTALVGRRLSPAYRYALWLLVAVRLALPVLPASEWSVFNLFGIDATRAGPHNVSVQPEAGWIITKDPLPMATPQVVGQISGSEAIEWNWRHLVLLLWGTGVALFLLRVAVANVVFARRIRRGTGVDDAGVLALLCACQRRMSVRCPVGLVETDAVNGPALWGLVRPTLLLPHGMLRTLSRDDLRFVFLHELAHLKRWDITLDWGLALLHAVHWFNPAVWFALARLRAERELSRDAMVLEASEEREEHGYGQTILKLFESISGPMALRPGTVGILEEKAELKRRIAMIAKFDRNGSRGRLLAIVLVVAIASVLLTDRRAAEAAPTQDDRARELADEANPLPPAPARDRANLPPDWPATREELDADAVANNRLNRRLPEVRFESVSLTDAIEFLRDVSGANIFVNWVVLEKAGIDRNTPVTTRLKDVQLSRAIEHILQNVGGGKVELGFVVVKGVITISTQEDLDRDVKIVVYDVRDLLVVEEKDEKRAQAVREELVREVTTLLQETVDPKTWIDKGGKIGGVRYLAGQLIISHTPRHHAQIARLFEQLREARAVQIVLQVKFLSMKADVLKELKVDRDKESGVAFMDDAQVAALVKDVEAKKGKTLAAPVLMLINGQRGEVKIGSEVPSIANYKETNGEFQPEVTFVHVGTSMDVTPTASADRKYVTLKVGSRVTELVEVVKRPWEKSPPGKDLTVHIPHLSVDAFDSVVSIPDSGTLAAVLKSEGEAKENDAAEERTLVLIRPRILTQREIEQRDVVPPRQNVAP